MYFFTSDSKIVSNSTQDHFLLFRNFLGVTPRRSSANMGGKSTKGEKGVGGKRRGKNA